MTTLKTLAALTLATLLAACAGTDTMSFLPADAAALNAIPTAQIAPLY